MPAARTPPAVASSQRGLPGLPNDPTVESTRNRSKDGCLNCRARQKKCPGPVGPGNVACEACIKFNVECLSGFGLLNRPDWMKDDATLKQFVSRQRTWINDPDNRDSSVPPLSMKDYRQPEPGATTPSATGHVSRQDASSSGDGSPILHPPQVLTNASPSGAPEDANTSLAPEQRHYPIPVEAGARYSAARQEQPNTRPRDVPAQQFGYADMVLYPANTTTTHGGQASSSAGVQRPTTHQTPYAAQPWSAPPASTNFAPPQYPPPQPGYTGSYYYQEHPLGFQPPADGRTLVNPVDGRLPPSSSSFSTSAGRPPSAYPVYPSPMPASYRRADGSTVEPFDVNAAFVDVARAKNSRPTPLITLVTNHLGRRNNRVLAGGKL